MASSVLIPYEVKVNPILEKVDQQSKAKMDEIQAQDPDARHGTKAAEKLIRETVATGTTNQVTRENLGPLALAERSIASLHEKMSRDGMAVIDADAGNVTESLKRSIESLMLKLGDMNTQISTLEGQKQGLSTQDASLCALSFEAKGKREEAFKKMNDLLSKLAGETETHRHLLSQDDMGGIQQYMGSMGENSAKLYDTITVPEECVAYAAKHEAKDLVAANIAAENDNLQEEIDELLKEKAVLVEDHRLKNERLSTLQAQHDTLHASYQKKLSLLQSLMNVFDSP